MSSSTDTGAPTTIASHTERPGSQPASQTAGWLASASRESMTALLSKIMMPPSARGCPPPLGGPPFPLRGVSVCLADFVALCVELMCALLTLLMRALAEPKKLFSRGWLRCVKTGRQHRRFATGLARSDITGQRRL